MAEAVAGAKSGKVVIQNIGLLLSGDIDKPILDADTIVVNDGLIVAIGKRKDCDVEGAKTVIDCKKTCVAPRLNLWPGSSIRVWRLCRFLILSCDPDNSRSCPLLRKSQTNMPRGLN